MIVTWSILAIFFNIMDSVTTELGARQYPDPLRRWEANPIARRIMLKSPLLMEVLKQVAVLAIIGYLFWQRDIFSIKLVAVALALVVSNNGFIYLSRRISKRKVISPAKALQKLLHIPEKILYLVILVIIFGLANIIVRII